MGSLLAEKEPRIDHSKKGIANLLRPLWIWMTLACMLLGISGAIRTWRDRQFQSIAQESENCPFPLDTLPSVMGNWHAVENSEKTLDPAVAKIAGSKEYLIRTYRDERSREEVSVLLLYGPAGAVFAHSPEVCCPAAGYRLVSKPPDFTFSLPNHNVPIKFRSAIYSKRIGRAIRFEEFLYTFRNHSVWLPDMSANWKQFRYHPGMFRIQLSHDVSSLEHDNQLDLLLKEIIHFIEIQLANQQIE